MQNGWLSLIVAIGLFLTIIISGCVAQQARVIENKSIIGQWGYYKDTNDTEYVPGDYSVRWVRILEFSDDGHFYKSDMAYVRQPDTGELTQTNTEYSSGTYYFVPGTPGTYGEMGSYKLNGKMVEVDTHDNIVRILKNVDYTVSFDMVYRRNTISFCERMCDEYYPINSQDGFFDYPVTKTTGTRVNVEDLGTLKETVTAHTGFG